MSNAEKPIISIPLALPPLRVLETERTAEGHFLITGETTLEGTVCPQWGPCTPELHGLGEGLPVRQLPLLERAVSRRLRPQRYRCPACERRPSTTPKVAWREENRPHSKADADDRGKRVIHRTGEAGAGKEEMGDDAVAGRRARRGAKPGEWPA